MAKITKLDEENASLIEYIDLLDHYPGLRCKICYNIYDSPEMIVHHKGYNCVCKNYNIYDSPEMIVHHKGYNCVCKNCIRDMTDIFELSESDLEDIITNAGRDLAKGIEQ